MNLARETTICIRDAARILCVTPATVRRYRKHGLQMTRVGKQYLTTREEVVRWIERSQFEVRVNKHRDVRKTERELKKLGVL